MSPLLIMSSQLNSKSYVDIYITYIAFLVIQGWAFNFNPLIHSSHTMVQNDTKEI
jgi:hypothetical protein